MKTRSILVVYGVIGVAFALAVGGVGLWGQARISNQLGSVVLATQAVRNAAMADVMHDAIRGNVLQALLGNARQSPDEIKAAQTELKEHSQKIVDYLSAAKRLGVSPEITASIDQAQPAIDAYVALAQAIATNPAQGQDKRAEFDQKFEALEQALERGSKLIETFAEEAEQHGAEAARQSVNLTVICLFLATGFMLLAAWRVSATLMQQLGGEPSTAQALMARVARGELSMAVTLNPGDNRSLMSGLSQMVRQLCQTVAGVTENASFVASASAQVSSATNDLSNRTQTQARSIERSTQALNDLADTVQQNAASASQANDLALNAADVAARGGTVFDQVVEQMRGINEASKTIFDIIGVIDGIAFQTNILALNAAVEAARAGEQGRGFAVVAGEVRTLARRSAEAAKEIKGLISASVERVEQGSALVDDAGSTMKEIVTSIQQVSHIIGEISHASRSQTEGIDQVRSAMGTLEQGTQENSALVEESAAAADSLKDQARRLADAMHAFQLPASPHASAIS